MVRMISDCAIVDPRAFVADGCRIGDLSRIGPEVVLQREVVIAGHVWVSSRTLIGQGSCIASHCLIGAGAGQKSQTGRPRRIDQIVIGREVETGRAVVIENGCTGRPTVIGDRSVLGSLSKVSRAASLGEGCQLGAAVQVGRGATLGASVRVGHGSIIQCGVSIGRNAAIGSLNEVAADIPPHLVADGRPATVRCINVAGLQRLDAEPLAIASLVEAFRLVYRTGMSTDFAEKQLRNIGLWTPEVVEMFDFLRASAAAALGYGRDQGRVA